MRNNTLQVNAIVYICVLKPSQRSTNEFSKIRGVYKFEPKTPAGDQSYHC